MSFTVPYTAFGKKNAPIRQRLLLAFEKVLDSGQYILGPEVNAFEQEFAAYCQTKSSVAVSSGACALHLMLRSLGLKPDAEVISPPNSFVATTASIALAGLRPVFADIRPDLNICPEAIEAAITPNTKVIIPVHLTGRPAPMAEIMEIAKRHNLFVLEDAAQAAGAMWNGKRVGSLGDAACFSLHPLKNLHAFGDGGMITTNDPAIVKNMLLLRNHGLRNRDQCDVWGFNSRLDEVQAALLRVQMTQIEQWTAERRRLAFRYNELLKDFVEVPKEAVGEFCVYQTYVVQANCRDQLRQFLRGNGVEAIVHYSIPIHLQPAAASLGYRVEDFPETARACSRILSLPLYPGLTASQQDQVVDLVARFYRTE